MSKSIIEDYTNLFEKVFGEKRIESVITNFKSELNKIQEENSFHLNDDKSLSIYIELPGYKLENISVLIEENLLKIKASREGFNKSSYKQSFSIPTAYDQETINASFENGMLIISIWPIQKTGLETKSKKIEIKSTK